MIENFQPIKCQACLDGADLPFEFRVAFQPIVSIGQQKVYAQEALCRGPNGEGAAFVLNQVNPENMYRFDQTARVKAIETASRIGIQGDLSINFLPNAVYKPETCIQATLEASARFGFDTRRLIFEFSEQEQISDPDHLLGILKEYRSQGFKTALDDFGAGYSDLRLLTQFQPDIVKLDRTLVSGIHNFNPKQMILKNLISLAADLNLLLVAEGIEEAEEAKFLQDAGVDLLQGYLLARPALEEEPSVNWVWKNEKV